jgi:EAL domain-containing protein (putative c-di-GMP-specific phosphodiesterase class I)
MGGNLNLELGAEGIGSRRQRERLVQLGCSLGQGCLYSTAVPPDHAGALLSTFVPSH